MHWTAAHVQVTQACFQSTVNMNLAHRRQADAKRHTVVFRGRDGLCQEGNGLMSDTQRHWAWDIERG